MPRERAAGIAKLRLAALVLFTFPGSPMIYYGDEAGMEGFEDPLNRGTYPWGREDRDLLGVVHPAGCPAECVSSPAVRHHLLALHRRSFVDFCPGRTVTSG